MTTKIPTYDTSYGILYCRPVRDFSKLSSAKQQEINEKAFAYCKERGIILSTNGNCHHYQTVSEKYIDSHWNRIAGTIYRFAESVFLLRDMKLANKLQNIRLVGGEDSGKELAVPLISLEKIHGELRKEKFNSFVSKITQLVFSNRFEKTGSPDEVFLTEETRESYIKCHKDLLCVFYQLTDKLFERLPLDWEKEKDKRLNMKLVAQLHQIFQDLLDKGEIFRLGRSGSSLQAKMSRYRLLDIKHHLPSIKDVHDGELILALLLSGFVLDFRVGFKPGSDNTFGFFADPRIKKHKDQNFCYTGLSKDCQIVNLKFCEADKVSSQSKPYAILIRSYSPAFLTIKEEQVQ